MSTIVLPDLGEGVSSGIVTSIAVKVGDSINDGDTLLEIETDKAVLPVPASASGTISEILVKDGDKIDVGQALAKLDGAAAAASEPVAEAPATAEVVTEVAAPAATGASENLDVKLPDLGEGVSGGIVTAVSVNIGDNVSEGDSLLEIETDKAVLPVPCPAEGKVLSIKVNAGDKISVGDGLAEMSVSGGADTPAPTATPEPAAAPKADAPVKATPSVAAASPVVKSSGKLVPAGPATRKLARELGIDLTSVNGSKKGGRVAVEDVKAYVKSMNLKGAPAAASSAGGGAPTQNWEPLPDFSKFGTIKKEKVSNLRNIISNRMNMCWNRIPHVFQFNEVDFTKISEIQKNYKADFKERGSSVSPTNFIIKAMAICLSEFPQFNSSFDENSGELILKDYINIGVAVDTPTGLIVPVLKGVDKMTIFDIGKELKELAKKTRDRKVTPNDLAGGSMTLSNLGGIGGTHFTPIVNWPEVAILGVGKGVVKPVYVDGEFVPRTMTTLTLSYDHRVIDGADGARFMVRLSEILEDIERTLLGG